MSGACQRAPQRKWPEGASRRCNNSYRGMMQRCLNKNAGNFHQYGGRGITICERWRENFANFYADMGNPPPGLTLDRRDHNGDYSKDNCRWATKSQQANNCRPHRALGNFSPDEITDCVLEWPPENQAALCSSIILGRREP